MVYFKFLSEITDIGLRISFKESGVKFTDGSKDFRHYRPNDVKEIRSFKIRTGDVRPQVGVEEISQKTGTMGAANLADRVFSWAGPQMAGDKELNFST